MTNRSALKYAGLLEPVSESPAAGLKFDHLEAMLTDIGVWQHAKGSLPDKAHGYSIDDEARALIVAVEYYRRGEQRELCERLGRTCFNFIKDAATTGGVYHNFCDRNGKWLDSTGSDDSFGRTLWSLCVAYAADVPFAPIGEVQSLLRASLPHCRKLEPLRSIAFTILGLATCGLDRPLLRRLADRLADSYASHADGSWNWFEDSLTYCNARLPQAMFVAARALADERYVEIGTQALDFLLHATHNEKGSYAPIGNSRMSQGGWYHRKDALPPLFDQQPVDAGALVECCAAAYQVTSEPRFRKAASDAFSWYFGENVHGLWVYDAATGGVYDALTRFGVNRNMGAESVLSIHLAHLALQSIE